MEEVTASFLQNVSWCYCQIPCLSQCSAYFVMFPQTLLVFYLLSVHLRQTAYVVFLAKQKSE